MDQKRKGGPTPFGGYAPGPTPQPLGQTAQLVRYGSNDSGVGGLGRKVQLIEAHQRDLDRPKGTQHVWDPGYDEQADRRLLDFIVPDCFGGDDILVERVELPHCLESTDSALLERFKALLDNDQPAALVEGGVDFLKDQEINAYRPDAPKLISGAMRDHCKFYTQREKIQDVVFVSHDIHLLMQASEVAFQASRKGTTKHVHLVAWMPLRPPYGQPNAEPDDSWRMSAEQLLMFIRMRSIEHRSATLYTFGMSSKDINQLVYEHVAKMLCKPGPRAKQVKNLIEADFGTPQIFWMLPIEIQEELILLSQDQTRPSPWSRDQAANIADIWMKVTSTTIVLEGNSLDHVAGDRRRPKWNFSDVAQNKDIVVLWDNDGLTSFPNREHCGLTNAQLQRTGEDFQQRTGCRATTALLHAAGRCQPPPRLLADICV